MAGDPVPVLGEDFFDWEQRQPERYELLDGIVRMMVGGSLAHHRIIGNLDHLISDRTRSPRCEVFRESFKLKAPAGNWLFPDLMVVCDKPVEEYWAESPILVAEVISPSSRRWDLGKKRAFYQSVPSMRHILFVDSTACLVEHIARTGETEPWRSETLIQPDDRVDFAALGLSMTVAAIYDGTGVDATPFVEPQRKDLGEG